jgi:glycosyltransferase involved in cell wall biosynthesis
VKPRVCITTGTYPLAPDDGMPRFVLDLAEALSRRYTVFVLAPDAPGARKSERMGDVEVRRFTYFLPRNLQRLAYGCGMRDNMRASRLARVQPLPYMAAQAVALRRLVRRERIALVNAHWILPQGPPSAWARGANPGRFPLVVTLHGGDVLAMTRTAAGHALARYTALRADAFLPVSGEAANAIDIVLGRSSGAVVQPMGVQVASFATKNPAPPETPFSDGYLLFVGRFEEKKGVPVLLRALPKVIEGHPGLGLVLAGYGTFEAEWRREVAELGLAESVWFAGRKPHAEVARLMAHARVVVVPSKRDSSGSVEGMPTVVSEALATGARLVCTTAGGMPDVVRNGVNGWICRENDPAALATALLDALACPDPDAVAREARKTAASLDWAVVAEHYAEVFDRLLSHRGAAP